MPRFVKFETLDGNKNIVERVLNAASINFVHAPFEMQQGNAVVCMSRGTADSADVMFAVTAPVHDFIDKFANPISAFTHDLSSRPGFENFTALINPANVRSIRKDGNSYALVTFTDGTEQRFHEVDKLIAEFMMDVGNN